ncbi:MAG: tRNA (adenosine(37)-N6)-threonylcarbamoyltransferase complex ATPase subunit type 1 TsaE [Halioglobus sp.]
MTLSELTFCAADESAMVALGGDLAAVSRAGLVVFLQGDLGMGKTTFTRGFIHSLGHSGAVKSPTYTLVEPYEFNDLKVFHFDLYRLGHPEELEFMGIRDYFGDFSVCLVEWPERGLGALPAADLVISIGKDGSGRALGYTARSEQGRAVLAALSQRQ